MTRARLIPCGVTKEIRALLPTWLASVVAMGVVAVLGDPKLSVVGALAYYLGSIALGSQSIGHEYTHCTLTLLLSQPAHRGRLFLVKLGVLTPMLLMLAAVAWGVLLNPRDPYLARYWAEHSRGATMLTLGVLCGLILAPCLTMLCRSPLASVVFTIATPAILWMATELFTVTQYGWAVQSTPDIERFELAIFWWGMLGLCAVAAVLNWRMFSRLEAIDGRDQEVQLPRWLRGRTATIAAAPFVHARGRSPFWLLVKKELRLQQMTFVVAGLYLLLCVMLTLLRHVVPAFFGPPLGVVTLSYSGMLALLIGSLASAEERHFGTLEWQVLLPIATWKQWAVKVGTALSLTIVLTLGLPVLLSYMIPSADHVPITAWSTGAIIVLTTGSLYVSSLCTNGLRAFLLSFPVILVVMLLLDWFFSTVPWRPRMASSQLIMAAGFVALALRFALVNHRSAERGVGRVWRQVSWMVGCLTVGVTLLKVVLTFY